MDRHTVLLFMALVQYYPYRKAALMVIIVPMIKKNPVIKFKVLLDSALDLRQRMNPIMAMGKTNTTLKKYTHIQPAIVNQRAQTRAIIE